MLIQPNKLKHWIDNFYGYGSWDARTWFIAPEESGGDVPEDVAEKVNFFYHTTNGTEQPTLCDIRELYQHARVRSEQPKASKYSTHYDYRFGSDAVQHNAWKNLIAFAHRYRNETTKDLFEYQKKKFLIQSAKKEALIQLFPLPSPHNHAWYYSWLDLPELSFIRSRAVYQEHVFPTRINTILTKIQVHKPELVLLFGMENINTIKQSMLAFFENTKFKMIKATRQYIPQYHRADCNGTTIVITTQVPTLRHNRPGTGFDWEAFANSVREKSESD